MSLQSIIMIFTYLRFVAGLRAFTIAVRSFQKRKRASIYVTATQSVVLAHHS